jgi:hypothetical protein
VQAAPAPSHRSSRSFEAGYPQASDPVSLPGAHRPPARDASRDTPILELGVSRACRTVHDRMPIMQPHAPHRAIDRAP